MLKALLIGLCVWGSVLALPGEPARAGGPVWITDAPDPGDSLRTDGRFVVYSFSQSRGRDEIQAVSIADGRMRKLATDLDDYVPPPAIANAIVVWHHLLFAGDQREGGIRGYNLTTEKEFTIAPPIPDADVYPGVGAAIGGGWVVWIQNTPRGQPRSLMARNIQSMDPPIILIPDFTSSNPLMSGKRVAWMEVKQPPRPPFGQDVNWALQVLTIGDAAPRTVATGQAFSAPEVAIDGDIVYLMHSPNPGPPSEQIDAIEAIDLRNEQRQILLRARNVGSLIPGGDGRYLYWQAGANTWHGYDRRTQSLFTTPYPVGHIGGGRDAWYQSEQPGRGIYTVAARDLLPSGPRSAPARVGVDLAYFPETQHTLAFAFKRFWAQSGGLPVFGYPRTEEFTEKNAETGQMTTVQYLERQRFEYHPEHDGTPYAVELGRLGVAALQQQGIDWWSLPRATPSTPHYFAQTGHAIAAVFWDYWQGQGLEFGDPGVSFAESLALFGYPISEPRLETNRSGNRVLTQWFERARFEYHPDNPRPYQVLLGQLGTEALAARDW